MLKKLLKLGRTKSRNEKAVNGPVHLRDLAICCIVKDENDYLEEWINYHRKTGVQYFYIYDNESSTPVQHTLADLNLSGYATVTVIKGKAKQVDAYSDCLERFGSSCKWIAFIDVDEFIVAKTTDGNLVAFLKNYESYGGLGVNWLVFGSNGHLYRTGKPQIESFTLRADENRKINTHIKSIIQPKFVKSAFNAHFFKYITGKFCVNENFSPVYQAFSKVSVNKIQINHYFCRSAEEFSAKMKRGRGDTGGERTLEEFHDHDSVANSVKDTTILHLFEKNDFMIQEPGARGQEEEEASTVKNSKRKKEIIED